MPLAVLSFRDAAGYDCLGDAMAIRDDSGPFMPVGRIALGRAVLVYDTWTTLPEAHIAIPVRGPRGTIEPSIGTGADLAAAVAAALQSLSRVPFTIAACDVTRPRDGGRSCAATVLVRARDAARPRYTTGHATAADEATAVAVAAARALAAGGFLQPRLLAPGGRDVEASAERIVAGIEALTGTATLPPQAAGAVRELVAHELHRFGAGLAILAAHAPDREGVLTRFDAQAALELPAGATKTSDTQTTAWWEWFPGLDNDDRTLREVLAELPAAPATAIPWIVRLFENPEGWLRLHGAIHLKDHDMVHVLLGRGLLDQDEAFVIGFTMGSTKAVSWVERAWFRFVVSRLYPEPYRISRRMLTAYDLGLEAGWELGAKDLHRALRDDMLDRPLGAVRRELGIDTRRLREFYARELAALPSTLASSRLPRDAAGMSPSLTRLGFLIPE
jgi:hypothetical protein